MDHSSVGSRGQTLRLLLEDSSDLLEESGLHYPGRSSMCRNRPVLDMHARQNSYTEATYLIIGGYIHP